MVIYCCISFPATPSTPAHDSGDPADGIEPLVLIVVGLILGIVVTSHLFCSWLLVVSGVYYTSLRQGMRSVEYIS